jgi:Ycf66 protein N-terminus
MLAYFLAIMMAIISLTLFFNAFISPKTHRQDDFLWSGLGLFYALILWICSERITGGVLLGQIAGVALTIAFVWENLQLRKTITAESNDNNLLEGFSLLSLIATSMTKMSGQNKTVATESTPSFEAKNTTEDNQKKESENTPTETQTDLQTEEVVDAEDNQKEESIRENPQSVQQYQDKEIKTTEDIIEHEDGLLGNSVQSDNSNVVIPEKKVNVFTRILSIFNKQSPSQKTAEIDSNLQETLDEIEALEDNDIEDIPDLNDEPSSQISEIDPKTTATEVEKAIDNLELSEPSQAKEITLENENKEILADSLESQKRNPPQEAEIVSSDETIEDMENVSSIEEENTTTVEVNSPQDAEAEEEEEEELRSDEEPEEDDIIESLSDLFPKAEDLKNVDTSENNVETVETNSEKDSQESK